jgi:hypothetical protein
MKKFDRHHPLFYPVLFAILIHLILIAIAMIIRLPGLAEIAKQVSRTFQVKTIEMKPSAPKTRGIVNAKELMDSLRFVDEDRQTQSQTVQDVPLADLVEKLPEPKPSAELEALLVETDERQTREQLAKEPKVVQEALSEFSGKITEENTKDQERFSKSLEAPLEVPGFEEGMPGFTPAAAKHGAQGLSADEGLGESQGDVTSYESLDDFLDIEVLTYQDPADGRKYYQIKIFAKESAKNLKTIPKEILFAVDSSLSISPDRLDEFKKGIRACLLNLNPGDLFNIVAFKDKATFFAPTSVPVTAETVKNAERFVSSLTSDKQTDVFLAFEKIVERPLAHAPSNVILISDGRPTHGVVDSRELITSVSRINQKVRPIFAFSGGAKVNRYLLDFIAYQNRGWSSFVKTTPEIDDGLLGFYTHIKDPIFLNLRYRLSGLNEEEVFPKFLPDFYRNATFNLYGTYRDEDTFSMQLLGDVDNKTKELIFSRSLKEAKKGTEEIRQGYAFNKIYHLISQATAKDADPALVSQIEALSRRYGVTTPYSPELEKID